MKFKNRLFLFFRSLLKSRYNIFQLRHENCLFKVKVINTSPHDRTISRLFQRKIIETDNVREKGVRECFWNLRLESWMQYCLFWEVQLSTLSLLRHWVVPQTQGIRFSPWNLLEDGDNVVDYRLAAPLGLEWVKKWSTSTSTTNSTF